MAKWKTKVIEVRASVITNVSPMTDDGGRDLTIEYEGKEQIRHAAPHSLALYEPVIGDYWVEYDAQAIAMPWNKAEFEKRHIKLED